MKIPPDILEELAKYINTEKGHTIEDKKVFFKIWEQAELPAEIVNNSLSVLKHLFDQIIENDISVDDALNEIKEFCDIKEIEGFEARRNSLKIFLTPDEKYKELRKFAPFQTGVVNTLYAISGVAQLRAAFKDRNSKEIVGYVPVLEARLTSVDQNEKEYDYFVFQAGIKGLNKLINDLTNYKEQLLAIQDSLQDKVKIFAQHIKDDKNES
jgi:hypothetical protein